MVSKSRSQLYGNEFFDSIERGARDSAQEIVPLVLELIQPKSVIDVGCATGIWLSVFQSYGLTRCVGIDGDYVDLQNLRIPIADFIPWDLKKPISLLERFDLVVSLEVAEHIPREYAESYIESLTKLGPVVLFSAAIPFQSGKGHINEQWPEYWQAIFSQYGYVIVDCLRSMIWSNDKVEPWYAQNALFFVSKNCLSNYEALKSFSQDPRAISRVHPKVYLSKLAYAQNYPFAPPVVSSSQIELRMNENRFGCLDICISQVDWSFDLAGESLNMTIQYNALIEVYRPIFGICIIDTDNQVLFSKEIQHKESRMSPTYGHGSIQFCIDELNLAEGQYFVDVGIYERNWSYTYDYHWKVYPINITRFS